MKELLEELIKKGFYSRLFRGDEPEKLEQLLLLEEIKAWFRNEHKIDIDIHHWIYENNRVYDFYVNSCGESRAYPSYERALEEGIKEANKLLTV